MPQGPKLKSKLKPSDARNKYYKRTIYMRDLDMWEEAIDTAEKLGVSLSSLVEIAVKDLLKKYKDK